MRNHPPVPVIRILAPLALVPALGACGGERAPEGAPASAAQPAAATGAAPADAAPAATQADPMAGQMAGFGGGLHALAEACGGYTAAQLDTMKAEQRDQAVQAGASAAEFDAAFARGYDDARAKIASASAEEREKSCAQAEQLRQMGAMQPR